MRADSPLTASPYRTSAHCRAECVIPPPIAHRGAGITAPTKTQAAIPDVTLLPMRRAVRVWKARTLS